MNNKNVYIGGDCEIIIKTCIVDYQEPINGGIPIIIGINIYHFNFQGVYWIHPNGNRFLECESNFLKLWGCESSKDIPFYKEICDDIENILPEKKEIFNSFNLK